MCVDRSERNAVHVVASESLPCTVHCKGLCATSSWCCKSHALMCRPGVGELQCTRQCIAAAFCRHGHCAHCHAGCTGANGQLVAAQLSSHSEQEQPSQSCYQVLFASDVCDCLQP